MLPELQDHLNDNFSGNIKFHPEIKVKREHDTLYISELKKIRDSYIATVEVFKDLSNTDKAPLNIEVLNEWAHKAILIRLKGMSKIVAAMLIIFCFLLQSCARKVYFMEKDTVTMRSNGRIKLQRIGDAVLYTPNTNPDTLFRLISMPVKNSLFKYGYGN